MNKTGVNCGFIYTLDSTSPTLTNDDEFDTSVKLNDYETSVFEISYGNLLSRIIWSR